MIESTRQPDELSREIQDAFFTTLENQSQREERDADSAIDTAEQQPKTSRELFRSAVTYTLINDANITGSHESGINQAAKSLGIQRWDSGDTRMVINEIQQAKTLKDSAERASDIIHVNRNGIMQGELINWTENEQHELEAKVAAWQTELADIANNITETLQDTRNRQGVIGNHTVEELLKKAQQPERGAAMRFAANAISMLNTPRINASETKSLYGDITHTWHALDKLRPGKHNSEQAMQQVGDQIDAVGASFCEIMRDVDTALQRRDAIGKEIVQFFDEKTIGIVPKKVKSGERKDDDVSIVIPSALQLPHELSNEPHFSESYTGKIKEMTQIYQDAYRSCQRTQEDALSNIQDTFHEQENAVYLYLAIEYHRLQTDYSDYKAEHNYSDRTFLARGPWPRYMGEIAKGTLGEDLALAFYAALRGRKMQTSRVLYMSDRDRAMEEKFRVACASRKIDPAEFTSSQWSQFVTWTAPCNLENN